MHTFGLYLDFLLRYSPKVCNTVVDAHYETIRTTHKKCGTEKVGWFQKKLYFCKSN